MNVTPICSLCWKYAHCMTFFAHSKTNIYLSDWPTGLDLQQQKVKSHNNLIHALPREFHQLSRAALKTRYSAQIIGKDLECNREMSDHRQSNKERKSLHEWAGEKERTYWSSDKRQAQLCLDSKELIPNKNN